MSDTDPITRASQSTTLPRQARARINMTTDPVPEGKVLCQPTHHMMAPPIDSGAVEGTSLQQQRVSDEGGEQPQQGGGAATVVRDAHNREVQKMHDSELGGGGHGHNRHLKPQQAGMDWLGASTAANKKMNSRQTHAGGIGGGGGGGANHNKHLDTVYRSAGKGNQKKG